MKIGLGVPQSIDTAFLKIQGNCLEMQNTTIPLNNISLFSTADVTPAKFPFYSIVLILGGIMFYSLFKTPATIAIIIGGLWIYIWYCSVQEVKKLKRLTIVTNSGNALPIIFDDQEFMDKVITKMTEVIREPVQSRNVTINLKECTFSNEASVVGNMYE